MLAGRMRCTVCGVQLFSRSVLGGQYSQYPRSYREPAMPGSHIYGNGSAQLPAAAPLRLYGQSGSHQARLFT